LEDKYQVLFVGTCFRGEHRDTFLAALLDRGVPLNLFGNQWERSPNWAKLKRAWSGPGTTSDEQYRSVIQGAAICLCLLSSGNRDLHTTRSLEIPSMGALLCAPRTADHQELYEDGEEAVFWDNADECAEACFRLLKNPREREQIASAGLRRALKNNLYNEPFAATVLKELGRS
jgi:hypothetical protein